MVHSCCAEGCRERFRRGNAVTFHNFPRDKERKRQWEQNIGRENFVATKTSKVCSKHFTDDSFNLLKLGGTWLKPTAVPTIFHFTEHSRGRKRQKSGVNDDESSTDDPLHSETPETERNYYLGEFEYEDMGSPEKAAATSSEKSEPNFEPEIVIKEEPIDIDEEQLPSTSRTGDEFILPWTPADTSSTSQHTPTLGVAFTVCKTEVTDDQEDAAKKTSNGNPKASKKKAGKGVVEQCEKRPRESEEDSAKDRPKDHFDAYGEYIAAKLRKLDWKSCAYVQKAIGDIIFEAEMGKYKQ